IAAVLARASLALLPWFHVAAIPVPLAAITGRIGLPVAEFLFREARGRAGLTASPARGAAALVTPTVLARRKRTPFTARAARRPITPVETRRPITPRTRRVPIPARRTPFTTTTIRFARAGIGFFAVGSGAIGFPGIGAPLPVAPVVAALAKILGPKSPLG